MSISGILFPAAFLHSCETLLVHIIKSSFDCPLPDNLQKSPRCVSLPDSHQAIKLIKHTPTCRRVSLAGYRGRVAPSGPRARPSWMSEKLDPAELCMLVGDIMIAKK